MKTSFKIVSEIKNERMYDEFMMKKMSALKGKSVVVTLAIVFVSALALALFPTKLLAKTADDMDELITTVEGQCSETSCYFPINSSFSKRITKIVITNSDTNVSGILDLTFMKRDLTSSYFGYVNAIKTDIGFQIDFACYGGGDLYPRIINGIQTTFGFNDYEVTSLADGTKATVSLYSNNKLNSLGINSCVNK